ncbi:AMP-binding protein [Ramlibacter tataouinensis]|uniref:AMP-binding protein n=1 Tax=Ramlibacter tataouinensis TaxID=94132 RepID=UPI0022F3F6C2|nr:AMP-binding protein [Ramlibacter tataouinensis]WBY03314.1 AMP-binding protein [Ramlibacter tataouinensis]
MTLAPLTSLADIRALEQRPLPESMPARSPYGLIAAAAQRFPGRDAFVFLTSGEPDAPPQRTSYAGLLDHIHRAANLFRSLGVGAGDAVALLAPNLPLTHAALWGAQLAGRACPINYLLQPEHIAALLQASGARVIVALAPHPELDIGATVRQVQALSGLPVLAIHAPGSPPDDMPDFEAALRGQAAQLQFEPVLHPDQVAACFHTGGTTGAPKLALHTQGNEAHTGWFAHAFYGFDEHTVEINGFPLFHVAGAFVYGLALLAIGATQLLPTVAGLRNPGFMRHYWQFCERYGVTALACVPTVLATLSNLPVDADISTVRVAYTGGSPLPTELAQQFEQRTGIAVRNILGMTESAGLISIEPAAGPRVPGSAGLPLPYTQVRVLPWRDGRAVLDEACPAGATGVIAVRGPHVSPGYSDPARNGGMFEGGWLVSGDLGHVDAAGYLHVTGRAKDVVIRGSHNIDPGLVEEAFMAHPAVSLCAVVGEPDAYAGELPVAFVVLRPGHEVDAAGLLQAVAPTVYERPAVPKRVTLVEAMPMTAIGKVYKPALRLMALQDKLGEVLAGLGAAAQVRAEDRGGSPVAVVQVAGPPDPGLKQRVHDALGAMAVTLEFRFDES